MVTYKAPSYGIFKTNITPMYWFGIPRNVKISGLTMDVDRITHLLAHKDNDHEQWVNYNRASGARLSAMEHLVPEHKTAGAVLHSEAAQWVNHMDVVNEMFSTDENPAHGISAVKAIQLAAAEGQKNWTITQANLAVALANITLDNDIKNDIRNAVNAGQEVTTHEKYINFHGKTSAGYIILNPTTGAGAYMISSGENGGDITSSFADGLTWITLTIGLADTLKSVLLKSSGPVSLIMGYLNVISSITSLGAACQNVAASALMAVATTAMFLLGALLSLPPFGFIGILVSVGIAIAMHTISLVIANGCRG